MKNRSDRTSKMSLAWMPVWIVLGWLALPFTIAVLLAVVSFLLAQHLVQWVLIQASRPLAWLLGWILGPRGRWRDRDRG